MLESIAPALDLVRTTVGPYYIQLKFFHLFFVMIWSWSTAVAYVSYVRVAYIKWQRAPDDPELKRRRDWAMEQFDRGVVLEHVAFPVILLTGLVLFIVGGWRVGFEWNWLVAKLLLVILVFVPMEALDYWLSHFGGNKYRLRKAGDQTRYELYMARHWLFLRVATPTVAITIPVAIYLAVVKPF